MFRNYIRTKDGRVFKVKDHFMFPLDYPKFSVYGSNETFYEAHVDGANDIKELFDEYWVVDGEYSATYKNFDIAKTIRGFLYGVVNGKSVAKYDKEKQEWRLL